MLQGNSNASVLEPFNPLIPSFLTLFGVGARALASRILIKFSVANLVTVSMPLGIRENVESVGGRVSLGERLGDVHLQTEG